MQKDLEKFENRSDDWLAKQRAHESRVSAWDLDDARKLKREHEVKHQQYNRSQNIQRDAYGQRPNVPNKKQASRVAALIAVIFYIIVMFVVILLTSI